MSAPNEYTQAVLQRCLRRVCEDQGFSHAEFGAVEALVEAVSQYVEAAGVGARQLAELAGRSKVSLIDLRDSLRRNAAAFGQHAPQSGEPGAFGDDGEDDGASLDDVPFYPRKVRSGPAEDLALSEKELAALDEHRGAHIPQFMPPFPPAFARMKREDPSAPPAARTQTQSSSAETTSAQAQSLDAERDATVRALLELTEQISAPVGAPAISSAGASTSGRVRAEQPTTTADSPVIESPVIEAGEPTSSAARTGSESPASAMAPPPPPPKRQRILKISGAGVR